MFHFHTLWMWLDDFAQDIHVFTRGLVEVGTMSGQVKSIISLVHGVVVNYFIGSSCCCDLLIHSVCDSYCLFVCLHARSVRRHTCVCGFVSVYTWFQYLWFSIQILNAHEGNSETIFPKGDLETINTISQDQRLKEIVL